MQGKLFFARWVLVAIMSLGLAGPSLGQATDHYEVPPGPGAEFDFSNAPIPAGFFEPGSEPYAGPIFMEGDPLDPGNTELTDTLILRGNDPFDRVDLPGPNVVQIGIEIVELNLKSVAPITVVVSGQDTLWDVRVDLNGAGQQQGQLDAIKTHDNGGFYDAVIPVEPFFTFKKVGAPDQQTLPITPPIVLEVQSAPWVHDEDPLLPVFVPAGAGFVPGIEELTPGVLTSQERAPVVALSVPNPALPTLDVILTAPGLALPVPALSPGPMALLALLLLGSALLVMRRFGVHRLHSS